MTEVAWTDDEIARLPALWAEGLSATEIGQRMFRSKNSVIGKVHRLGLSSRPNAIKEAGALTADHITQITFLHRQGWGSERIGKSLKIARERVRMYMRENGIAGFARPGNLQPPIPKRVKATAKVVREKPAKAQIARVQMAGTKRRPGTGGLIGYTLPGIAQSAQATQRRMLSREPRTGRITECKYPLNDQRPWRFCCKPTEPGSSWCSHHHDICLVPRGASHETQATSP